LAEPVPMVGTGSPSAKRKLTCGKQKSLNLSGFVAA
jgi:hypothetical protein